MTGDSHFQPMTEHTPTPWQISDARTVDDTAMIVGGHDFEFGLIADVTEDFDAAFIVEACNSHALLKARIEELEVALQPFADFADPRNTIPPDTVLTAGSPMARKQITMANCYAASAALNPTGAQ